MSPSARIGNDLAATLTIPEDPGEAVTVLRQNRVRTLDMVRVRSESRGEQFFINVATGGMGAEVSGAADGDMKKQWGKLSYLRASLEVARETGRPCQPADTKRGLPLAHAGSAPPLRHPFCETKRGGRIRRGRISSRHSTYTTSPTMTRMKNISTGPKLITS